MTTDVGFPVATEWVLRDDPSVHVANVELGVTFYLADAEHWGRGAAARALETFVQLAPQDFLLWYTTSTLDGYRRVRASTLRDVLDAFSVGWLGKLRHGFEFVLADDMGSECTGFRYVEIDEKRAARTSLLELTIPAHLEPALLLRMADAVFGLGPIWCGIGGYALRYNPLHKGTAFTAAHGWTRRYLGLDIQDRDRMPWLVRGELPGVSWLNFLGAPWLAASGLDVGALVAHRFAEPISVSVVPAGARIVAGERPNLGDLNRFQDPRAYRELAAQLAAYFVSAPPPLYGRFLERGDAAAWFRRHLDPGGWR